MDIINKQTIEARVESVQRLISHKGIPFLVIKICEYTTRKHLFTKTQYSVHNYKKLSEQCSSTKPMKIGVERVKVKLEEPCYYIYDWDDVHEGKCRTSNLGEIARMVNSDNKSVPIIYNEMTFYAIVPKELPKQTREFVIEETYKGIKERHYVKCLSVEGVKAKLYVNDYQKRKKAEELRKEAEELRKQEEERLRYEEEQDALYNAWEEHRYDNIGMSEEDAEMDALEHGDAEIYGF